MEDENSLNLSLALPCGGSPATLKSTNGSSSDIRRDEGDRDSKLIDDFKNFLDGGSHKQDSVLGSQRSNSVKPEENFFDNLSNSAVNVEASTTLNGGGFWVLNDNRHSEVEEENRSETGIKRKSLYDEINHPKKREKDADRTRASHMSITTDEGSTAEIEDADSEAEGSTSRLDLHHDDGSKRHSRAGGLSEVPKEVHGFSDSSTRDLQKQKMFTISSEKEITPRNVSYGIPFPPQSVNIENMPYTLLVKDSNPIIAPGTSNYSVPGMMRVRPTSISERPGSPAGMSADLPFMLGYSPVQLPVLDKDNYRGLVPQSQQLPSPYFGRGPPNSDNQNEGLKLSQAVVPVISYKSSETFRYDGKALELAKGDGKHHTTEEGSSSQPGDDVKQNSIIAGEKLSDQQRAEGIPSEFQAVRAGPAADLKFGGCGSFPNLPWVSTTGPGPKGRTISGVTYRYSATQVRIVCACHGTHMSPDEFIQHANEEQINQDNAFRLASFPSSNPAASAQN